MKHSTFDGTRESARLAALASYDILDTARESDFDEIAAVAAEVCGAPVGIINLIAETRQFFKAEVGLGLRETPLASSFGAQAILEDDLLIVADAAVDSRFAGNPLVTGEPRLRFYAGAPLKTADGLAIGALCVLDRQPRTLTDLQARTLRVLARQVMARLDLRRALRAEAARAERRQRASALTEERLLARDERSRIAQEAARIGTFELDVATGDMTVSPEMCRIFGIPDTPTAHASTFEALVAREDAAVRSSPASRMDASARLDVEYRIRRASDGALRWVARYAAFVTGDDGTPRMFGAVQDVTSRRMAAERGETLLALGDRLREAATPAEVADAVARAVGPSLHCQRAGYVVIDQASGYAHFEGEWLAGGARSIAGRHPLSALSATIGRLAAGEWLAIPDTARSDSIGGDAARYEVIGTRAVLAVPLVEHGRLMGMLFAHDALPRAWSHDELAFLRGAADRAFATMAKLNAQAHQNLLNDELSHRLKNTLAMVQAIAMQTLKDASDQKAVAAFNARVHALSHAHDVLLQRNWAAAKIRAVIEGVVGSHVAVGRADIGGPDITLQPRIALSLSLILHELLTNATKYGALSNDSGRIALNWRIDPGVEPTFVMTWKESGGPEIGEPSRRGFGTRLIRTGLAGTGGVTKHYHRSGFEAEFVAALAALQQAD